MLRAERRSVPRGKGEFSPTDALLTLRRFGVDFVCIGGVAAVLQGANYVTFDLDVCPDSSKANLDRLAQALEALGARVRVEGIEDGLPFDHSGESLARARIWNLKTSAGDLDLCFLPAGTSGFDDLSENADPVDIEGEQVLVASIADIIRSKRAANRDKDHLALPILERMQAELDR
ncbi:MAG: hypothetical protein QOF21_3342 [Actinomycetota bacterium]